MPIIKVRKIDTYDANATEYSLNGILHFWLDDNGVSGMEMCLCNIPHDDLVLGEEVSREDLKKIRDYLDEQLFFYSSTHPRCDELRRIQRDTIHEFDRTLAA